MHKVPSSIFRNILILILAVSVTIATRILYQGHAKENECQDINKYICVLDGKDFRKDIDKGLIAKATRDDVDDLLVNYHLQINELFNTRIKKLVELGLKGNKKDLGTLLAYVAPPGYEYDAETKEPTKRKPCGKKEAVIDLSTYCLSQSAINEYMAFREAMNEARRRAKREIGDILQNYGGVDYLLDEKKRQRRQEKLAKIDREIEVARNTLDKALAAYNELQMALPLHAKYMQVIGALEDYRDKVAAIRKQIDKYPPTFLDVTTTSCT